MTCGCHVTDANLFDTFMMVMMHGRIKSIGGATVLKLEASKVVNECMSCDCFYNFIKHGVNYTRVKLFSRFNSPGNTF